MPRPQQAGEFLCSIRRAQTIRPRILTGHLLARDRSSRWSRHAQQGSMHACVQINTPRGLRSAYMRICAALCRSQQHVRLPFTL